MQCQRCKSERVVYLSAKSSDRNYLSVGPVEGQKNMSGYMPCDMGIGNEDYVTFDYCLDCGQIEGNWPLPETQLEKQE